jgi:hypothetical protein
VGTGVDVPDGVADLLPLVIRDWKMCWRRGGCTAAGGAASA